jgi:ubiquinone/menaquinone biosynthesis C-methylase UbiE
VTNLFPPKSATVLDLGCGQGRLSIPVSAFSKKVVGVDFTPEVIEKAKYYSTKYNCSNTTFILSDIHNYVKEYAESCFDVVLLTEVTFFLPSYKQVLSEICRILKTNGVAFISFRSQYFCILHSLRNKKWESAKMAIEQREGYLFNGQTWFSWHTKEDIVSLLTGIGFSQIDCVGIGPCSGIGGDPLELIARPCLLDEWEQSQLLDIELKLAESHANFGRYILAIARK